MSSDPRFRHLTLVDPLLRALGYEPARATAILNYCWLWGTAEGCPQFRAEVHRTAVEELLPDAEPSQWEEYADWVWSITPECTGSGAA
jgi:hypothetical protein